MNGILATQNTKNKNEFSIAETNSITGEDVEDEWTIVITFIY